jgi:hypothetical protein
MRSHIRRFVQATAFIGFARLILIVAIIVYASSVVGSVNYQTEKATYLSVNNGLLLLDRGYSKVSSTASPAGTSCVSPANFNGSPGVANTQLTSGDFLFDVQVNTTASSTINTCYTVTFYLSTGLTNETPYGPVYVATSSSITVGQTIDCKFDIGSSLPSSPFTFKVIVQ